MTFVPELRSQTRVTVPAAREDEGIKERQTPQRRTMRAARLTRSASAKIVIWGSEREKRANANDRRTQPSRSRCILLAGARFKDGFSLRTNKLTRLAQRKPNVDRDITELEAVQIPGHIVLIESRRPRRPPRIIGVLYRMALR
jgi:hypothetical protein